MSQMWHRMRGLANPTPGLETGGEEQNAWDPASDVLLPDDHFARIHNPANGRVPPQLPSPVTRPQWPEFPLQQYARFFRTTPGSLNEQLAFQAQSVRIDNFSSHWIYVQSAGMYLPPFIYGAILPLQPAVMVAGWITQPPLGHADASTALDSNVITIWFEDAIPPSSGTVTPST